MTSATPLAGNLRPQSFRSMDAGSFAQPASYRVFIGIFALLFVASAALTVAWCGRMSAMGGMPMPGGWTMSKMWMRMPGQKWPEAAASFLDMWVVMMVAMMSPSLAPMLCRYMQVLRSTSQFRKAWLTTRVGIAYFFVWALFGLALFPLGAVLAAVEMDVPVVSRAVPMAVGVVFLVGGALQFTAWKTHHLACCRTAPCAECTLPADAHAAWRQGIRFGLHCGLSCANLTAILLAVGVMDLRAMLVVTAAISAERLAPAGERIARGIGIVVVAIGLFLIARAAATLG